MRRRWLGHLVAAVLAASGGRPAVAEPARLPGEKSGGAAVAMAIAAPALGALLLARGATTSHSAESWTLGSVGILGLVAGPSVGHVYIGDLRAALVGTSVRLAAGAYVVVASGRDDQTGVAIGGIALVTAMVFEWGHTKVSANRYNAALRAQAAGERRWIVTPTALLGRAGPAPGLMLGAAW